MFVTITEKVKRAITHIDYLANTNVLFYCLNILKLISDIIMYKSYIFEFKALHMMLPITLN